MSLNHWCGSQPKQDPHTASGSSALCSLYSDISSSFSVCLRSQVSLLQDHSMFWFCPVASHGAIFHVALFPVLPEGGNVPLKFTSVGDAMGFLCHHLEAIIALLILHQ